MVDSCCTRTLVLNILPITLTLNLIKRGCNIDLNIVNILSIPNLNIVAL